MKEIENFVSEGPSVEKGENETILLPVVSGEISCGFPSPAEDCAPFNTLWYPKRSLDELGRRFLGQRLTRRAKALRGQ